MPLRNPLFARIRINLITHAVEAHAIENAALEDIAMVYRGSSDLGHRY